jgi:pyrroline-5-carboxylate reductase
MSVKLGVIGGGVMGSAIVSRLIAQGTYQRTEIAIGEPTLIQRESLHQLYGVEVTDDNNLVAMAPVLLLAVKPQIFGIVASQIVRYHPEQVVISILAGVNIAL